MRGRIFDSSTCVRFYLAIGGIFADSASVHAGVSLIVGTLFGPPSDRSHTVCAVERSQALMTCLIGHPISGGSLPNDPQDPESFSLPVSFRCTSVALCRCALVPGSFGNIDRSKSRYRHTIFVHHVGVGGRSGTVSKLHLVFGERAARP